MCTKNHSPKITHEHRLTHQVSTENRQDIRTRTHNLPCLQNKRKMTLEDFGRINRSTNDGDPMPPDLLREIYASIARDELKISAESAANELPSVFWTKLALEARLPRSRTLIGPPPPAGLGGGGGSGGGAGGELIDREMFELVWGPTLAAVSVLLDNASDGGAVRRALDCLLLAAKLAAYHQVRSGGGSGAPGGQCMRAAPGAGLPACCWLSGGACHQAGVVEVGVGGHHHSHLVSL